LKKAYKVRRPLLGSMERSKISPGEAKLLRGNKTRTNVLGSTRNTLFEGADETRSKNDVNSPSSPLKVADDDTSIAGSSRNVKRRRSRVCINRLVSLTWKDILSPTVVSQYPQCYDLRSGTPRLRVDQVNTTVALPSAMRRARELNTVSQNRLCLLERMIQFIRMTSKQELCSKRSLTSLASVAALCREVCRVIQSSLTSNRI
jgi:hypothetical protein